ncbi:hypothetical protein F4775DRAFT_125612 [Biscogniauxia sp. FL1348]|nr:hypothetical protein F4775DRAFT_125612 [Biscogniauxia sp. FL1348]
MSQSRETHIDAFLLTAVGRWAEDKSTELHDSTTTETARHGKNSACPRTSAEGNWVPSNPGVRNGRYDSEPCKQTRQNRSPGLPYRAGSPTQLARDHSIAMREVQLWHPALERTSSKPWPRTRQQGGDYVLGTYSRDKKDSMQPGRVPSRVPNPATPGKRGK